LGGQQKLRQARPASHWDSSLVKGAASQPGGKLQADTLWGALGSRREGGAVLGCLVFKL
jgi:hypothetical protein